MSKQEKVIFCLRKTEIVNRGYGDAPFAHLYVDVMCETSPGYSTEPDENQRPWQISENALVGLAGLSFDHYVWPDMGSTEFNISWQCHRPTVKTVLEQAKIASKIEKGLAKIRAVRGYATTFEDFVFDLQTILAPKQKYLFIQRDNGTYYAVETCQLRSYVQSAIMAAKREITKVKV